MLLATSARFTRVRISLQALRCDVSLVSASACMSTAAVAPESEPPWQPVQRAVSTGRACSVKSATCAQPLVGVGVGVGVGEAVGCGPIASK